MGAQPDDYSVPDPYRRLHYRFLSLPFQKRLHIALGLGLLHDEDRDVDETQRGKRFMERAKEEGLLATLWDLTEACYGPQHTKADGDTNPYRRKGAT
ncbi:MAG: hypothetical protein KGJ23_08720 [Euryarchaeota archaeon]|nr:hypothetical protein [Euryarchaeota archaeon]MDE1836686.1 hypothetical protein [Euryarchaeota archaeon]MDE1880285.1 hypothetical protein [Euryarchaeota archaeon]MDE2044656.1 hypothetical protein [Thermoplasmata archaeon]